MINDWKLGMKMMRHAYGIKMNCILGGMILVLGIASIALGGTVRDVFPATYLVMAAGMLPTQMLYSLSITGMIQASPMKKKLQTSIPAMVNFTIMSAMYLVTVLIYGIMLTGKPEEQSYACMNLIMLAFMLAVVMFYMGVAYKYFIIASVIMIPILCLTLSTGLTNKEWLYQLLAWEKFRFWQTAVGGIGILAVGAVLQCLSSLLVYKAPIDKLSQSAFLRRVM